MERLNGEKGRREWLGSQERERGEGVEREWGVQITFRREGYIWNEWEGGGERGEGEGEEEEEREGRENELRMKERRRKRNGDMGKEKRKGRIYGKDRRRNRGRETGGGKIGVTWMNARRFTWQKKTQRALRLKSKERNVHWDKV